MASTFQGRLVIDGVVASDEIEFECWTVGPTADDLGTWGGRFPLQAERLSQAVLARKCEIRLPDGTAVAIAVTGGGAGRADFRGLGLPPAEIRP
jgi:hypothetical protein